MRWSKTVDRLEKREFVTSLSSDLAEANLVVVTRQVGMTVTETLALRRKMREVNAHFKVAKNTLVRIAIEGSRHESLKPYLTGPMALAFSADPIAAAKIVCEYANGNDKMEIVCGVMGDQFLDANGIQALAKLPSLDELRGKLIGLIQAPATKVAGVVQAPASQLARVFSAYASKS